MESGSARPRPRSRGGLLPATRLWGAAEVLRERTGLTLPGYWMAALDEAIAAVRAHVADDAFKNAWTEGRAMTCAETIAFGLFPGQHLRARGLGNRRL